MKKVIILIMLLCTISNLSFSQKTNLAPPGTRQDYLLKSKRQQTISYALSIPGAVASTAGLILYFSEFENGLTPGSAYNKNQSKTGELLMYIGGGLILAAIPFEIASRINKKKAMTITFKNQPAPFTGSSLLALNFVPSITLRLRL